VTVIAQQKLLSKYSLIIAAAALLAPAAAHAQERTLTLDEVLRLAKQNNRDLQAARARVAQAQAGVQTAWSALLPTVALQGKYTHNYKEVPLDLSSQAKALFALSSAVVSANLVDPNSANGKLLGILANPNGQLAAQANAPPVIIQKGEQLDFVASATLPLVVPPAYFGLRSAHQQEDAAAANYFVSEATVLFAASQAYFACAGTDELVQARKHAISVTKKALDNARARLEAGVVNRVEVQRAELQQVRAEQALVEAQDSQAQTYLSLATLIVDHQPFRVAGNEAPPAGPAEPVDKMAANALTLRPEFMALEKTNASYSSTASSNLWKWAPTLSAFGNVRAFNYSGFSGNPYSWAVGLQADWLLYDGGVRDAQRHLAMAQLRESEARLDQLRDTVRDDVRNAARAVNTKRSALATAERSLQLSRQTLDLVQVQHDAGTATQLDLLQAQDNLVGAEVALAQAHFDLALSALSLERTAGTFPAHGSYQ
jgi:outer membrane protein TolC